MKMTLKIGRILAWFNLIYWGFGILNGFFSAVAMGNPLVWVIVVLMAAIPLNSYAALQLHKSIRRPEVKLSHNTPVGIRFVGSVVIFIGICFIGAGLIIVRFAKELLPQLKEQTAAMKGLTIDTPGQVQSFGIVMIFLGGIMLIGAMLNMRLLRWYYLVKKSDIS